MINYSIIIPHYNSLDTLSRTLNSVPVRDDVEVLVIDNSPTPVKREQIEGVTRDYKLLYSDNTKGAGHARNVGLDHAKGKWLVFADADDFFTEDFNFVLDKYKDSDWDVVMFPIKTVDSKTLEPNDRTQFYNDAIFSDTLSDRRKLAVNITPWSKLVNAGFVERHNIRYGETPVSNDVLFNAYVAVLAERIKIDKERYIYTLTYKPGSLVSRQSDEMLYIRIQVDLQRNNIYRDYGYGDWNKNWFPYGFLTKCESKEWFGCYIRLLLKSGLVFSGSPRVMCKKVKFLLSCFLRIVQHKQSQAVLKF